MGGFLSIIKINITWLLSILLSATYLDINYNDSRYLNFSSASALQFIWIQDKNYLPTSIHPSADNWRLHQQHLQKTVPLWWRGYWWWPVDLASWVEKPQRCTRALSWKQGLQGRTKANMRHPCKYTYPCWDKTHTHWFKLSFYSGLRLSHAQDFVCDWHGGIAYK